MQIGHLAKQTVARASENRQCACGRSMCVRVWKEKWRPNVSFWFRGSDQLQNSMFYKGGKEKIIT